MALFGAVFLEFHDSFFSGSQKDRILMGYYLVPRLASGILCLQLAT